MQALPQIRISLFIWTGAHCDEIKEYLIMITIMITAGLSRVEMGKKLYINKSLRYMKRGILTLNYLKASGQFLSFFPI